MQHNMERDCEKQSFSFISSMLFVGTQKIEQACYAERGTITLVLWSMIQNIPVVFGEKQIGLLQSIGFDQSRKRVQALIVSGGLCGKKLVRSEDVLAIADEFILVKNWNSYHRAKGQQIYPFVRDTEGFLAGRITDYAFDRKKLNVLAVEVITGYLPKESRNKAWIYTYSCTEPYAEITIPVVLV